ncbi:FHA domain-containing protein [bacterium]|nr:FHA domain-containing protein [bacterium]
MAFDALEAKLTNRFNKYKEEPMTGKELLDMAVGEHEPCAADELKIKVTQDGKFEVSDDKIMEPTIVESVEEILELQQRYAFIRSFVDEMNAKDGVKGNDEADNNEVVVTADANKTKGKVLESGIKDTENKTSQIPEREYPSLSEIDKYARDESTNQANMNFRRFKSVKGKKAQKQVSEYLDKLLELIPENVPEVEIGDVPMYADFILSDGTVISRNHAGDTGEIYRDPKTGYLCVRDVDNAILFWIRDINGKEHVLPALSKSNLAKAKKILGYMSTLKEVPRMKIVEEQNKILAELAEASNKTTTIKLLTEEILSRFEFGKNELLELEKINPKLALKLATEKLPNGEFKYDGDGNLLSIVNKYLHGSPETRQIIEKIIEYNYKPEPDESLNAYQISELFTMLQFNPIIVERLMEQAENGDYLVNIYTVKNIIKDYNNSDIRKMLEEKLPDGKFKYSLAGVTRAAFNASSPIFSRIPEITKEIKTQIETMNIELPNLLNIKTKDCLYKFEFDKDGNILRKEFIKNNESVVETNDRIISYSFEAEPTTIFGKEFKKFVKSKKEIKDNNGNLLYTERYEESEVKNKYNIIREYPDGTKQVIGLAGIASNDGNLVILKELITDTGNKTEYTYEESPDSRFRESTVKISDKDGNILLDSRISWREIDKNNFQTDENGEKYDIQYSKTKVVVTRSSDGKTIEIPVGKISDENSKNIIIKTLTNLYKRITGNNAENNNILSKNLLPILKKLPGSIYFDIAEYDLKGIGKNIDGVKKANAHYNNDKNLISLSGELSDEEYIFTLLHELGHFKAHSQNILTNDKLWKIFQEECNYFLKNCNVKETLQMSYFTENMFGDIEGLNEIVAETNALLHSNNTDPIIEMRGQLLQQYFPKTFAKIAELLREPAEANTKIQESPETTQSLERINAKPNLTEEVSGNNEVVVTIDAPIDSNGQPEKRHIIDKRSNQSIKVDTENLQVEKQSAADGRMGFVNITDKSGNNLGYVNYNLVEVNGQKSLHFEGLVSNVEGAGIGSRLIQELILISKELGAEGRLTASASPMANRGGKLTNIEFYYKLGFKAVDPAKDAAIREYIERGEDVPLQLNIFTDIELDPNFEKVDKNIITEETKMSEAESPQIKSDEVNEQAAQGFLNKLKETGIAHSVAKVGDFLVVKFRTNLLNAGKATYVILDSEGNALSRPFTSKEKELGAKLAEAGIDNDNNFSWEKTQSEFYNPENMAKIGTSTIALLTGIFGDTAGAGAVMAAIPILGIKGGTFNAKSLFSKPLAQRVAKTLGISVNSHSTLETRPVNFMFQEAKMSVADIMTRIEAICREYGYDTKTVVNSFFKGLNSKLCIFESGTTMKKYLGDCLKLANTQINGKYIYTKNLYHFDSKNIFSHLDTELIQEIALLRSSNPYMSRSIDILCSAYEQGNLDIFSFKKMISYIKEGYLSTTTINLTLANFMISNKHALPTDFYESEFPTKQIKNQRMQIIKAIENAFPHLKKDISDLRKSIGEDIYRVQWENIYGQGISGAEYKNIIKDIPNLRSLKDIELNPENFYINIQGYGRNESWARQMTDITENASTMLREGADSDKVLAYIASETRQLTLSGGGKGIDKADSYGILRCKRDGYTAIERGKAMTPFGKGTNYNTYASRFREHYAPNELHNPYPEQIELTRVVPDGRYPIGNGQYETTEAMIHPEGQYASGGLDIVKFIHSKMMNKFGGKILSHKDLAEINETIGEIHWILAHTMPWSRGSDAIVNSFVKAIYQSLGIKTYPPKAGISFDLEAFCTELADYKKQYSSYYENPPEFMTIQNAAAPKTQVKEPNKENDSRKSQEPKLQNLQASKLNPEPMMPVNKSTSEETVSRKNTNKSSETTPQEQKNILEKENISRETIEKTEPDYNRIKTREAAFKKVDLNQKTAKIRSGHALDQRYLYELDFSNRPKIRLFDGTIFDLNDKMFGNWLMSIWGQEGKYITIGREGDYPLTNADNTISRHHLIIIWHDNRFVIKDISSNGGSTVL